ncbi:MAG: SCO family protein [Gammaproteobacteria bacterium]
MPVLRTLLASFIVLMVGGTVLTAATDHFQAFTSEAARFVEIRQHPPQVPAVTLETQSGTHINLTDLRGKWLLVDFIYTRCMTYCSVLGGEFAQLQTQLAKPLAQGKLQLLSISFDPQHDAPPQLADYLGRFHDHGAGWLATRPVDADGLKKLERVFGITVIPDGLGGYVHNAAIEIVNPQGRLIGIFPLGNPVPVGQAVLRAMQ